MIYFDSRITRHVGFVSMSTLKSWGLEFEYNSKSNQEIFERRVNALKESTSSNKNGNVENSKVIYFYKPEAYFHPTYRDKLAQQIIDLSNLGFEVTLESDSIGLINYFGDKIERGEVSKDDFKVRLETEKDGEPYFTYLTYDDQGVLNGVMDDDHFPIGYFN